MAVCRRGDCGRRAAGGACGTGPFHGYGSGFWRDRASSWPLPSGSRSRAVLFAVGALGRVVDHAGSRLAGVSRAMDLHGRRRPVRPPDPPPSPDSLTLEPWIVQDRWGKEVELERPSRLPLDNAMEAGLARFTDAAWKKL